MASSPEESILEEIIFGIKDDIERAEQSQPAGVSKASSSHFQIPQEVNCPKPRNLDRGKVQLDVKTEAHHPSVSLVLEELPVSKSRLNPLAARAALASLVSAACDYGTNGTKSNYHQITKKLSPMDKCSLKEPNNLFINEHHGSLDSQLEKSNKVNNANARSKHSTTALKSTVSTKNGRVTRSSIQKANSAAEDTENISRSSYMHSEVSALPSGLRDEANLTFKAEKDAHFIQSTNSSNPKRSKPKKTVTTKKQGEPSEMEEKAKRQYLKSKFVEAQPKGRLTRSAAQKATENVDGGAQGKSHDQVKERVTKKARKLDRDNSVESTKADNSKMNMLEEETIPSQKEMISSQMASLVQRPARERVKANKSIPTKNAQQTEGKSAGGTTKSHEQDKKSSLSKKSKSSTLDIKQEKRFSHRLRFLPRTRSQVKS
ncbi:hypothetical protein SAY87_023443 [Trapa incisa]|uniref:Uncharacterized protein n=1 Tax=Trapa incisa TaxID=236973 RepID=A0AAN7KXS3_9MYRT|nr:hypothetical protein SAY87_023443 [Trapa incisa]